MTRLPYLAAASSLLAIALTGSAHGSAPADTPARAATATGTPTTTVALEEGTSAADLMVTIRLDRMRAQRDAFEARQLVDRAAREEVAGRDDEAERLYARAVELDPKNERAQLGLATTRDRLGLVTDGRPLLDRAERESRARLQEVTYRFEAAMRDAADGIAEGTPEGFAKSRLALDRARLARGSALELFSPEALDSLDARLAERDLDLEAAIQNRADAIERARAKEHRRQLKDARVNDIRLEL